MKKLLIIMIALLLIILTVYQVNADTLGRTSSGNGWSTIRDTIQGSSFTATADGMVHNITTYIDIYSANTLVRCAIYDNSTGAILDNGTSEELNTTVSHTWITFDFVGGLPNITNGNVYYLCCWCDADTSIGGSISRQSSIGWLGYVARDYSANSGVFPTTISLTGENRECAIYCTYTNVTSGWSNTCPVSSGENPANKSIDVSLTLANWSVNITDIDANNTNGSIVCSNGDSVNWTNESNGTKTLNLTSGLVCNTNYTVWLNFTDGCDVNETYWFITVACPVDNPPTLSAFTVANGSTCVDLNVSWNVTINDPEGNNTNGSIFCSNGNNMTWTNLSNGTRSLSIVNLTCGGNYTVWLNLTDGYNDINNTYWFTTCDCAESNVSCDCDAIRTIVREELANDSTGHMLHTPDIGIVLIVLGICFSVFVRRRYKK